jgi:ubiquinone/menaquinone biosynthesis C-methylase UbiE
MRDLRDRTQLRGQPPNDGSSHCAPNAPGSSPDEIILSKLAYSSYDLATRDRLPLVLELMSAREEGIALDIGIGTGYTTYRIFGHRPTVCVDVHQPNLTNYRDRVAAACGSRRPLCVVADASALPFKSGTFQFTLCSEVLEHLEDDDSAVRELSRTLAPNGRAVITVPYTGFGFTSFLEVLRIKTVHDVPGPEYHVRPGYDEKSLQTLLERHGLVVERHGYYFRLVTKLFADLVSLGHLIYQRVAHHRRGWTWAEATAAEATPTFRLYTRIFPVIWAISRLDRLLARVRGFGLVLAVVKRPR